MAPFTRRQALAEVQSKQYVVKKPLKTSKKKATVEIILIGDSTQLNKESNAVQNENSQIIKLRKAETKVKKIVKSKVDSKANLVAPQIKDASVKRAKVNKKDNVNEQTEPVASTSKEKSSKTTQGKSKTVEKGEDKSKKGETAINDQEPEVLLESVAKGAKVAYATRKRQAAAEISKPNNDKGEESASVDNKLNENITLRRHRAAGAVEKTRREKPESKVAKKIVKSAPILRTRKATAEKIASSTSGTPQRQRVSKEEANSNATATDYFQINFEIDMAYNLKICSWNTKKC